MADYPQDTPPAREEASARRPQPAPMPEERHPHLGPEMRDEAVSKVAYTDHTLALRSRDRAEASRWAKWAREVFTITPRDPERRITEQHIIDVFSNTKIVNGKAQKKLFSERMSDAKLYGEEKTRQLFNFVAGMLEKCHERKAAAHIGDFDWEAESKAKANQAGARGATSTGMMGGVSYMDPPAQEPAAAIAQTRMIGHTKALPAPAKALPAPPKALAAPPKALPAPPKGLPSPPRRIRKQDDDQR